MRWRLQAGLSPCLTSPTSVPHGTLALSGVWTFLLCILQASPPWPRHLVRTVGTKPVLWRDSDGFCIVVFSLLPLRLLFPVLDRSFDTESTLCGLALREALRPRYLPALLQHTGSLQWALAVDSDEAVQRGPSWVNWRWSWLCMLRCGGRDGIGFLWRASWSPRTMKERSLLCLAFAWFADYRFIVYCLALGIWVAPHFSEGHFLQMPLPLLGFWPPEWLLAQITVVDSVGSQIIPEFPSKLHHLPVLTMWLWTKSLTSLSLSS